MTPWRQTIRGRKPAHAARRRASSIEAAAWLELVTAGATTDSAALSTAALKALISQHHRFDPRNLTSTLVRSRRIAASNHSAREKGEPYRWFALPHNPDKETD